MKKIVLTGGGSAGHVVPNLSLLPYLKKSFGDIEYIGGAGIEKQIICREADIPYHQITCVKLRRKLSLSNLLIPFKLIIGICQARRILKKIRPDVVFSKGGFVSLPVVIACRRLKIPVVAHESDLTAGLANKIARHFCRVICTTFETTAAYFGKKGTYTGSPIRQSLYFGSAERAKSILKFKDFNKPMLLIIGGSLGARAINAAVRQALNRLTQKFNVCHLVGKGNLTEAFGGDIGAPETICTTAPNTAALNNTPQARNVTPVLNTIYTTCTTAPDIPASNAPVPNNIPLPQNSAPPLNAAPAPNTPAPVGATNGSYIQIEYTERINDLYAAADLVISRAGSNSVCEILALKKPALLIPLPLDASRGDQIQNAKYFEERGLVRVLRQEALTAETLPGAVDSLFAEKPALKKALAEAQGIDGTKKIFEIILKNTK
jgi:UDP-N-acetylglucosamine--N-acetylmuramyl-(pentapeptide) pyrophosphoryl-undecaprenol N-acetylglucosamine transferase